MRQSDHKARTVGGEVVVGECAAVSVDDLLGEW